MTILFPFPIHVRDERASKIRSREELAPEYRIGTFSVVLLVLRHTLEIPLIPRPDFDLLQADLAAIGAEDHDKFHARYKARHPKWDAPCLVITLSHVERMKVQRSGSGHRSMVSPSARQILNNQKIAHSLSSAIGGTVPVGMGMGPESSHLIGPCLVLSCRFVYPPAGLWRGQE